MIIRSLDRRLSRYEKPLRKTTEGFFKFHNIYKEVDIYIVNSSQIRKLNLKYRGVDKPTDVLAIEDPKFPGVKRDSLGEIYLNPSYLKSKPYDIHYILIHGLLHLLGFTHQKKSDNMKMEKREKEILKWLGDRY